MTNDIDLLNNDVSNWWSTDIIDMRPGIIRFRGKPIEELIGNISFAQMIWFMLRGEIPNKGQAHLFECALVASVDHGPQAPSIAAARMAATCGLGLNNVMATAVNMLGDVHGGAGEQCVELYGSVKELMESGDSLDNAVKKGLAQWMSENGRYVAGYGHRFHKPVDPRAPKLLTLVEEASRKGIVSGEYAVIGKKIEDELCAQKKGRAIPMNIDGATAVIFSELGFSPQLARGIFCLSRSVGILAHGWEQMQQGGRNKGPIPRRYLPKYTGPQMDKTRE